MIDVETELVVDARALAAEGPTWDAPRASLVWLDVLAGRLHRYYPDEQRNETMELDQPVGCAVPRAAGGLVLGVRDGFASFDEVSGELDILASVERNQPENHMNDGKCDSAGRCWAGTMGPEAGRRGEGALYRLDPDLRVTRVLGGVRLSNGLGWSLDDRAMYYIDSLSQRVDAFDFDPATGRIENRRALIEVPVDEGTPDGMTVDADGFLWVALWDGWGIRRYAPDGSLDARIDIPARRVTSCGFGGPDLRDLYITTARYGIPDAELEAHPYAGGVFRARPGVAGLPPQTFAG